MLMFVVTRYQCPDPHKNLFGGYTTQLTFCKHFAALYCRCWELFTSPRLRIRRHMTIITGEIITGIAPWVKFVKTKAYLGEYILFIRYLLVPMY